MARTTVDRTGSQYRRYNDWVRGRLGEQKMKQAELAEYLGLTQVTLSNRIRGKVPWLLSEMLDAVEYFGGDLNDIFR